MQEAAGERPFKYKPFICIRPDTENARGWSYCRKNRACGAYRARRATGTSNARGRDLSGLGEMMTAQERAWLLSALLASVLLAHLPLPTGKKVWLESASHTFPLLPMPEEYCSPRIGIKSSTSEFLMLMKISRVQKLLLATAAPLHSTIKIKTAKQKYSGWTGNHLLGIRYNRSPPYLFLNY